MRAQTLTPTREGAGPADRWAQGPAGSAPTAAPVPLTPPPTFPAPRPRHPAKERGLASLSLPLHAPHWLLRLSIQNLFLMGVGGATQSAPNHVCRRQPTSRARVGGLEAIEGEVALPGSLRPGVPPPCGPGRYIVPSPPSPRGSGEAACLQRKGEM